MTGEPIFRALHRRLGAGRVLPRADVRYLGDETRREDTEALTRSAAAAKELSALATRLGGAISGEHGIDWVKPGELARRWSPRTLELHAEIKHAWDPRGLLNPGKKV